MSSLPRWKATLDRVLSVNSKARLRQARRIIRSLVNRPPPDERVSFGLESIFDGHFKVSYRGVWAVRCPFDYCLYQMILSEVKPDLIIEIGTQAGGSALYFADFLGILGQGIVHTIDIVDGAHPLVKAHPRIKTFVDGWEGYDLAEAAGFKTILVIEDGSHLYADTLGALRKFSPLVATGSYFIVEDGIVATVGTAKTWGGGPTRAIREFLLEDRHFTVDRRYCDMFGKNATFNVNGYLRRVS